MSSRQHIPVLDHLRGIAALSVCLFHFCGNRNFLAIDDPVRRVGAHGWLGVEAFFVISGFVIPFSLYFSSYRLKEAFRFWVRRLKRLEPSYFACIALVLFLNLLSSITPGFRGHAFSVGFPQIVAHVAYLNSVLDYGWVNPVFWTLAIEFQYYIFIAVAFPVLNRGESSYRGFAVCAVATIGVVGRGASSVLPCWLPLFAMGMAVFQFSVRRISLRLFITAFTVVGGISLYVLGTTVTVVGIATALAIVIVGSKPIPRPFALLAMAGTISYSLYLLHVPLGGRVINLATRLPDSRLYRYPAIVAAFAVSIFGAYWFWRLVEKPSQRWAKASGRKTEKGECGWSDAGKGKSRTVVEVAVSDVGGSSV